MKKQLISPDCNFEAQKSEEAVFQAVKGGRMMRVLQSSLVLIGLVVLISLIAPVNLKAQPVTLGVVADNQTLVPGGGGGDFTDFNSPVFLGGNDVAFRGFGGTGMEGIYTTILGVPTLVANKNTPVPGGGGGSFTGFGDPASLGGGDVAFFGEGGTGVSGIYKTVGGVLMLVADRNTPVPGGGGGNFTDFSTPVSLGGGEVVFVGLGGTGVTGIYKTVGGVLTLVANTNTLVPGGGGAGFVSFGLPVSIGGGEVAFLASGGTGIAGIYKTVGGVPTLVADRNTPVPGGGGGSFTSHQKLISLGGGEVAFFGEGGTGASGIYKTVGGILMLVADENTLAPGGDGGGFRFFGGPVSLGGSDVAFYSGEGGAGREGIFKEVGGVLMLVANEITPVPGGGGGSFTSFGDPVSLGGSEVAFFGEGGAGESGIYKTVGGVPTLIANENTLIPGGGGTSFTDFFTPVSLGGGTVVFKGDGVGLTGVYIAGTGSTLNVTKTGTGTGTVTSVPLGINCGAVCSEDYVINTVVTLTAVAGAGSVFAGWTGDPDCTDGVVTMDMSITCTAIFAMEADLSIVKTASPNPVELDSELTYTIEIENLGPDPAVGVVLTDILPGGVMFISSSVVCDNMDGTLTCELEDIDNGDTTTVTIVVVPPEIGDITNSATVSAETPDPNMDNNTSTIITQVEEDVPQMLDVVLDQSEFTVNPGGMVSMAVEISNPPLPITSSLTQTKQTATGVVLTIDIPEGFDVEDIITTQGVCDIDLRQCTIGDIMPGETVTVVLDAIAPQGDGVFVVSFRAGTSTGQMFSGTAIVTVRGSDGGDGNCALASSNAGKPEIFGLLAPFVLLPLMMLLRRKRRGRITAHTGTK